MCCNPILKGVYHGLRQAKTEERKQREFEIEYAHNSTALAGNSLTLEQTLAVLDAVDPPQQAHQKEEDSSPSEEETPQQTM